MILPKLESQLGKVAQIIVLLPGDHPVNVECGTRHTRIVNDSGAFKIVYITIHHTYLCY